MWRHWCKLWLICPSGKHWLDRRNEFDVCTCLTDARGIQGDGGACEEEFVTEMADQLRNLTKHPERER